MTHHIDYSTPFIIDGAAIAPVKVVKLLGIHIDSVLSLNTQVSRTVSSCFYQLRRLKAVRRSSPIEAAKTVLSSFVTSRVDYCNGLMAEITQQQVNRMQDSMRLLDFCSEGQSEITLHL